MPEKDLVIKIDLDRSKAHQQDRAFLADQKKLNADVLTAARTTEAGRAKAAKDATGAIVAGSKQATEEVVAGHKKAKAAGVDSFAAVTAASALAHAGVAALRDMVNGLAQAFEKAGQKSRSLAGQFGDRRESLGTLAALQGVKADSTFTLKQARFAKATGTSFQEAVSAQTSFMNSGAQFVGRSMSAAQAEKFQQGLATMAAARGIDPAKISDLGGRILGMKDYSKYGDKAAEMALGDAQKTLAILSSGQGEEGLLSQEVGKLGASLQSEDETRGVFKEPAELAKFVSVMAEGKVEGQAEAVRSAVRATRGFSKKKGRKTLAAAGVLPSDDQQTAITKIGKWADAEAKRTGMLPSDILAAGFDDSLAAEGIGILYNRGVVGGGFAAREATAAGAGPEQAAAANAEFLQGERGQRRIAQAAVEEAQLEAGARNSELETLRLQATARLLRRPGGINTNATNFNDYLNQKASFGLLGDSEQKRIDDEAQRMLMERSPAGTAPAPLSDVFNISPTAREEDLRARMGRVREAGGDPLGAGREQNAVPLLKEIRDRLPNPNRPPAPGVLVPPPEVPRR